jgi:hypothetical protein
VKISINIISKTTPKGNVIEIIIAITFLPSSDLKKDFFTTLPSFLKILYIYIVPQPVNDGF